MHNRTRIALMTTSRDRPACTRSAHHSAMSEAGATATAVSHTVHEDSRPVNPNATRRVPMLTTLVTARVARICSFPWGRMLR